MNIEKVLACAFLLTMLVSLWTLIYVAGKVSHMLRELRVLISGTALGLQTSAAVRTRTQETLGKVEEAVFAAKDAASLAAEKAVGSVEEIKQVVREGLKDKTGDSHY